MMAKSRALRSHYHTSSFATGTITVDGSIEAGDTGTITIGDRSYTYTVQAGDTLDLGAGCLRGHD